MCVIYFFQIINVDAPEEDVKQVSTVIYYMYLNILSHILAKIELRALLSSRGVFIQMCQSVCSPLLGL